MVFRTGLWTPAVVVLLFMIGRAGAESPEVVYLAGSDWVGDAPTKLAAARGWFDAPFVDGPRIEPLSVDSGYTALQLLLAGEVDFALAATTPVAAALLDAQPAGDDLLVLASVALSNRTHHVLANSAAGISRPADISGRRVGVMEGTSGHFGWSRFVLFHDIDKHTTMLVYAPISELGALLAAGEIDAAVLWEPWASTARDRLGDRAVQFSMQALYSMNWLLVTRRSVLDRHPALAEGVLRAYNRAVAEMERDPAEGIRWHAEAVNIPVTLLTQQARDIIWHLTLDWSVLTNMAARLEWLQGSADEQGYAPVPSEYLWSAPLREVAREAIQIPHYLLCDTANEGCLP